MVHNQLEMKIEAFLCNTIHFRGRERGHTVHNNFKFFGSLLGPYSYFKVPIFNALA